MRDRSRTRLAVQDNLTVLTSPIASVALPSRVAAQTIRASTVEPGLVTFFPSSNQLSDDTRPFRSSFDSSLLESDTLPKYRLSKSPFARGLRRSHSQDEPSLSEILELERNAWLDDTDSHVQDRSEEERAAQDAATLYPSEHGLPQLPSVCSSRSRQKSFFQEGSMTESSKAVASTWQFLADYKSNDDHDLSDPETTPRASAASRASTCSSIDINEFKPLPATPSTFRNTIRRLGQKVVHAKPSNTTLRPMTISNSEVKVKKGLRKSISIWKIFNNPLSDWEGDPNSSSVASNKKNANTSTRAKIVKTQFDGALPAKSVLDERKRKAEIAYSQQFGTVRKKAKHSEATDNSDAPLPAGSDYAQTTVRKRELPPPINCIGRSRSQEPDTDRQTPSAREEDGIQPLVLSAPNKRATSLCHKRSQSYDSGLCSESKIDHVKKQSRRELEKENQRLRLMLRGRASNTPAQDFMRIPYRSADLEFSGNSKQTALSSATSSLGNKMSPEKYVPTSNTTEQAKIASNSANIRSSSRSPRKSVKFLDIEESSAASDVPPVPSLSQSLQQRGPLSVTSGNLQRPKETATIKHRAPTFNAASQGGLPRPLSMVLEGFESDHDEEHRVKKANAIFGSLADKERTWHEEQSADSKENHQDTAKVQQWAWPEDVF